VQFPEELDMSLYTQECTPPINDNDTKSDTSYILTGVLMHVGSAANHGHYVAHIKDVSTGHWFKFSDTQVETLDVDDKSSLVLSESSGNGSSPSPLRTKKLKSANTKSSPLSKTNQDDAKSPRNNKIGPKLSKKLLKSNSAYMLVYSSKNWLDATSEDEKENSCMRRIVKHLAEKNTDDNTSTEATVRGTQLRRDKSSSMLKSPLDIEIKAKNGEESFCLKQIGLTTETANVSTSNLVSRRDNNIFLFSRPLSKLTEQKDMQHHESENEVEELPLVKKKRVSELTQERKIKRIFTQNERCGDCEGCKLPQCGQCITCLEQTEKGENPNLNNICILNPCQKGKYDMLSSHSINRPGVRKEIFQTNAKSAKEKTLSKNNIEKKLQDKCKQKVEPNQPVLSKYPKEYQYMNGTVYPLDFPLHLKEYVEKDKQLFQEQLTEKRIIKKEDQSKSAIHEGRLKDICQKMVYESDSESEEKPMSENEYSKTNFEFVPKKALCQFLESSSTSEKCCAIDTTAYLCAHGKLDVDLLTELKLVTDYAADKMFKHDRLKLNGNLLCRNCVINRCRLKKLALKLAIDGREIAELLKSSPSIALTNPLLDPHNENAPSSNFSPNRVNGSAPKSYWVGKLSFKTWKNLAKDKLHREVAAEVGLIISPSKNKEVEYINIKTNGEGNFSDVDKLIEDTHRNEAFKACDEKIGGNANSVKEANRMPLINSNNGAIYKDHMNNAGGEWEIFNEDITCKHGNLCPNITSKGRLVPAEVWKKFLHYFDAENCPTFTFDSEGCSLCTDDAKSVAVVHEEKKVYMLKIIWYIPITCYLNLTFSIKLHSDPICYY
jgi:hypothetical protein